MEFPQPPWPPRDRRPDALGNLRVLPDEFLCTILELLSAPDLGRLACVSSVMYILCNEEPLWMNICLRDGGQIEYKGSWKKTALYRQNLCKTFEEYSQKTLNFDGFNSLFLYRRWYRCFTTLNAFSLDRDLERRKDLTLEEFHSQYDGKKPVLLTDLARTWTAKNSWTFDQLSLKYGDVAFRISQRSSKKITMKFKDYIRYMELQHDEDPLYVFDDKFGEVAPALLEDYDVPHLFQEDFFDVLDDQRPPFRWLIIGPGRSGASWHVDPALTSAWNTLLSGQKRWALYPPGRVPLGVTVHVNEEDGDVHIDGPSSLQWWFDIYPHLAEHDKPFECTQLPGETIYVPSGWWHCVLNLEPTIAVTQNFVNATNFEFACLDMAPGHRHKGVCRAGLLAIQDKGFESVKNDSFYDTEQMNYLDMTRKGKRLKVFEQGKQPCRHGNKWNTVNGLPEVDEKTQGKEFSYSIDFLAKFLDEERDHYSSIWSPSNCIGPRELREWLHKLWILKPAMRQLLWKGASLALNVDKWAACMLEICARHNLPSPLDEEKFPVGTGSNPTNMGEPDKVFLISDHVIKVYVEGGLGSSIHGLGTEMEFYNLLHEVNSPLIDHVPEVLASGIIVQDNGFYRAFPWDGKGVPDAISKSNLIKGDFAEDDFCFGVWRKKQFEIINQGTVCCTSIWPYLITKRCKGDIFAKLRDALSADDAQQLASFLGEQMRNLHVLPLPHFQNGIDFKTSKLTLTKSILNGLIECSETPAMPLSTDVASKACSIPPAWNLIISTLANRKKQIKDRLVQWGDPIPEVLIEKVEEYIPHDPIMLLDLFKDTDGLYKVSGLPTWIHSDIMDDNIHMEPCNPTLCFHENAPDRSSIIDDMVDSPNSESKRKWHPTHILDFSDLSVGIPLYDLIPIYLDVFRGNVCLLKQFLKSYMLSFVEKTSCYDMVSDGQAEIQKFKRLSYRAMCFCIFHDENVLGAIFSLWKELKVAKSWDEVELTVWSELNNYQGSD